MRQLKITQSITNRRESESLEKYFQEKRRRQLTLAVNCGDVVACTEMLEAGAHPTEPGTPTCKNNKKLAFAVLGGAFVAYLG